ncbi:hypothetical protein E2C01_073256 [Portunus trituberculatus]|uniref:Uncharacterized protein n=1 Tax=Portunus trituberculatus TaxID=210409 RepID=A0A5B7I2C6_PORTR|nr:hypothetical protein [Portunus trituberculatus]
MTLSYTYLTLSYKLKFVFERQEIVLLRAGAGGGFAQHGRSGMEPRGGTVEHGCLDDSWGESKTEEVTHRVASVYTSMGQVGGGFNWVGGT